MSSKVDEEKFYITALDAAKAAGRVRFCTYRYDRIYDRILYTIIFVKNASMKNHMKSFGEQHLVFSPDFS